MEKIPFEAKTNVSKIVIVAYEDKKVQSRSDVDPFVIPINPETYSQNFKVDYDVRRGQGQQKTEVKFKSTAPEELKLEFVFDGTETVQSYFHNSKNERSVRKQVTRFLNTVYNMSGEIHMPRYLKLFWGKNFMLQCVLTNLDINYTLFDTAGDPLRAKISATFLDHIAKEQRVVREGKSSPNLTHIQEFKEGDRLDLLSFKIYNDVRYLPQLAKANGLTSFRNIEPGTSLVFPPFDKNEI